MKKKELEGMTVAELRALAKKHGIKPGPARKAEIIEKILRGAKKRTSATTKTPEATTATAAEPRTALPAAPEPTLVRTGPGLDAPKDLMPFMKKRAASAALATPTTSSRRPAEKKIRAAACRPKPSPAGATSAPQISVTVVTDYQGGYYDDAPHSEGVDWIAALALDPDKVFVTWELTEQTMLRGTAILRVYDVTGRRFPLEGAVRVFDACIPLRAGSAEIGVSPGREYVVDVGVISPEGRFMPARRSGRIFTPPGRPAKGNALLPEGHFQPPPGAPGSP